VGSTEDKFLLTAFGTCSSRVDTSTTMGIDTDASHDPTTISESKDEDFGDIEIHDPSLSAVVTQGDTFEQGEPSASK
jgi:hypothetical protein